MAGFISTLSQFVSFNILLKCHSAICSGPLRLCGGKVNIKKRRSGRRGRAKSHRCPRRRSGRDQKWHFPHVAARSRCSGHRYQLQRQKPSSYNSAGRQTTSKQNRQKFRGKGRGKKWGLFRTKKIRAVISGQMKDKTGVAATKNLLIAR